MLSLVEKFPVGSVLHVRVRVPHYPATIPNAIIAIITFAYHRYGVWRTTAHPWSLLRAMM